MPLTTEEELAVIAKADLGRHLFLNSMMFTDPVHWSNEPVKPSRNFVHEGVKDQLQIEVAHEKVHPYDMFPEPTEGSAFHMHIRTQKETHRSEAHEKVHTYDMYPEPAEDRAMGNSLGALELSLDALGASLGVPAPTKWKPGE